MADDRKKQQDERAAAEKKRLADEREARQKAQEERAKTQGRPTPTQEECDMANLGLHPELSPDGSPVEQPAQQTRHMDAAASSGGGYHTRQSTPQPRAPSSSHSSS